MSIDGIGSRQYLIATLGVLDPTSVEDASSDPLTSSSTSGSATAVGTDPLLDSSSDSASSTSKSNFSTAASLLSSLSQLQKQDPAAFKEVTGEIADTLNKASAEATDTTQSYSLSNLAAQFSNASATGSLTAVSTARTGSSLRGYGTSGNLVTSYLSQGLDPDLFSAVNTMVTSKLDAVLSDSE